MNDTTPVVPLVPPPRPLAYLIVWGPRGQGRDVRMLKKEAEEVARVMRGQVIPLIEATP